MGFLSLAFHLEGQLEFNTWISSSFRGMNKNLLPLPYPLFLTHIHTLPAYERERTGPQLFICIQDSQNDSCTFTQLSVKGDSITFVLLQMGERTQKSNSDGVLGKNFLQSGK